jgi:hypothetical protein
MAEKRLVVNGAICICKFGAAPDKLKVATNTKEYANDRDGSSKAIATTKDIASTFQAGTFGVCSKQRSACKSTVTQWSGFYEKVQLSNGGYPLLEDSKATCPVGGKDCIEITFHGQTDEMTQQNVDNANPEVMKVLNPAVDIFAESISDSESRRSFIVL